jgi:hypothetical protein
MVTKYIPPKESDLFDSTITLSREALNWYNPPPVPLDHDPLIEYLKYRNGLNPIGGFVTKRKVIEHHFGIKCPRFEQGQTEELTYNWFLNHSCKYLYGEKVQIESKYLSWPKDTATRFRPKKPDLSYISNKTGILTLVEVKMFYNTLNFSHAEHLFSAIDQLLLMELFMTHYNGWKKPLNLELTVIVNPGILNILREVVQKMDLINKNRHINIPMRILNIYCPWEEIPHMEVLNSYS